MNALRLHGKGDLRLHDEPQPEPGEDEVLLRVTAVGLCGSDRHWYVEGGIGETALTRPLVLGHEVCATIVSGPRAGERVAVDPAITCGRCAMCLSGHENLCLELRFAGHGTTDGGLRAMIAWPERLAHRLPDSLSDVEGALLEPLGVALHALELGRVEPGTSTAVFGCGPLGLLLVQLLRLVGSSPIVAADPLPHRAEAAYELGASPGATGASEVVFEVTDANALDQAVEAARPGGRLVLVGIPHGDRSAFTASTARRKGLTLALCRRMRPAHLERAIELAAAGRVTLSSLVSERYALPRGRDAFEALAARRGLKLVVEPQRGLEEMA
ncbi:MAG: alcohol dehydrogenase [Candidatus Rokuibacteriota bacterium]|nr:MAG: alcohol dehydrogenase [Candidatus Rokubacteria bacterium]